AEIAATAAPGALPIAAAPVPAPPLQAAGGRQVARSPQARPPAPPAFTRAPVTVSRQVAAAPPQAASAPAAGSAGAGGGGADSDAAYRDLLRRLQQEQEQLGQLIPHPF